MKALISRKVITLVIFLLLIISCKPLPSSSLEGIESTSGHEVAGLVTVHTAGVDPGMNLPGMVTIAKCRGTSKAHAGIIFQFLEAVSASGKLQYNGNQLLMPGSVLSRIDHPLVSIMGKEPFKTCSLYEKAGLWDFRKIAAELSRGSFHHELGNNKQLRAERILNYVAKQSVFLSMRNAWDFKEKISGSSFMIVQYSNMLGMNADTLANRFDLRDHLYNPCIKHEGYPSAIEEDGRVLKVPAYVAKYDMRNAYFECSPRLIADRWAHYRVRARANLPAELEAPRLTYSQIMSGLVEKFNKANAISLSLAADTSPTSQKSNQSDFGKQGTNFGESALNLFPVQDKNGNKFQGGSVGGTDFLAPQGTNPTNIGSRKLIVPNAIEKDNGLAPGILNPWASRSKTGVLYWDGDGKNGTAAGTLGVRKRDGRGQTFLNLTKMVGQDGKPVSFSGVPQMLSPFGMNKKEWRPGVAVAVTGKKKNVWGMAITGKNPGEVTMVPMPPGTPGHSKEKPNYFLAGVSGDGFRGPDSKYNNLVVSAALAKQTEMGMLGLGKDKKGNEVVVEKNRALDGYRALYHHTFATKNVGGKEVLWKHSMGKQGLYALQTMSKVDLYKKRIGLVKPASSSDAPPTPTNGGSPPTSGTATKVPTLLSLHQGVTNKNKSLIPNLVSLDGKPEVKWPDLLRNGDGNRMTAKEIREKGGRYLETYNKYNAAFLANNRSYARTSTGPNLTSIRGLYPEYTRMGRGVDTKIQALNAQLAKYNQKVKGYVKTKAGDYVLADPEYAKLVEQRNHLLGVRRDIVSLTGEYHRSGSTPAWVPHSYRVPESQVALSDLEKHLGGYANGNAGNQAQNLGYRRSLQDVINLQKRVDSGMTHYSDAQKGILANPAKHYTHMYDQRKIINSHIRSYNSEIKRLTQKMRVERNPALVATYQSQIKDLTGKVGSFQGHVEKMTNYMKTYQRRYPPNLLKKPG